MNVMKRVFKIIGVIVTIYFMVAIVVGAYRYNEDPVYTPQNNAIKTAVDICADAMVGVSQDDVDRDCGALNKEEVYAAAKLARASSPKAQISIRETGAPIKTEEKPNTESPSIAATAQSDVMAIAPQAEASPAEPKKKPGLGLTYADVAYGFDKFGMEFDAAPSFDGEYRRVANANTAIADTALELIGDTGNITKATIIVAAGKGMKPGTNACVALFLDNIFPTWDGKVKWLGQALKKVKKDKLSNGKETIVQGEKKLELLLDRESGLFMLTASHKDS